MADEIIELAGTGMPPMDAIKAGTSVSADGLGVGKRTVQSGRDTRQTSSWSTAIHSQIFATLAMWCQQRPRGIEPVKRRPAQVSGATRRGPTCNFTCQKFVFAMRPRPSAAANVIRNLTA
jgi:hypothetical protein